MERFFGLFLVFLGVFLKTGFSLFREEYVTTTQDTKPPYLVRILYHVYYIGVHDNGTLSCKMPGAVSYNWNGISKEEVTEGGYVYSWVDKLKIPDPARPWEMEIHRLNFLTGSLVVQCQGKSGYDDKLIAEILWVVTRLHSPLGYPTDPLICGGSNKCERYRYLFRITCNPGPAGEYQGSISTTLSGKKCSDWNMMYRARWDLLWFKYPLRNQHFYMPFWGEHNYCRIPSKEKWKTEPECYVRSRGTRLGEPERCSVPKCSDCMYGKGNGKLAGYSFRVPKYEGLAVATYKSYQSGRESKYRDCYRFAGKNSLRFWYHENLCKLSLVIRKRYKYKAKVPSCLVYKGGGSIEGEVPGHKIKERLELAQCRIRQCTVRIVWFLFLDEKGHLIIDGMSSEKPRKFTVLNGQDFKIKYYVFGVNLLSGLSVGSEDNNKRKIVLKWKHSVNRVPKMSVLRVGKVTKAISGLYYLQYEFGEADRRIELGIYRQMFEIEIVEPLTITLTPSNIELCEWDEVMLELKTKGDFKITSENVKWSYTLYENVLPLPVTLETKFVRVSDDGMKVHVNMQAQIFVSVSWQHGTRTAKAKVTNVEKPVLQNISPFLTVALPGETVRLSLATDSAKNVLRWIHDAQEIADVPEDPNMAFSQIRTAKEIIYSLKIENIHDHHYGVFIVKAWNSKNCQHRLELILKKPPTRRTLSTHIGPTLVPLTNKTLASFKVIMDFMDQECSNLTQFPPQLPTAAPPSDLSSVDDDDYDGEEGDLLVEGDDDDEYISGDDDDEEEEEEDDDDEEYDDDDDDDDDDEDEEDLSSESEDGKSRRKKRAAPLANALCIYLQLPDPYFEIKFESITRMKGIRLLHPPDEDTTAAHSNITYRLMYSINGCKWKVYGIKSYKDTSNISEQANDTDLVKQVEIKYDTKTFAVGGNISWIGKKSIMFAKYIRLLPTGTTGSGNKTCIRVSIYGCSAGIFEVPKEQEDSSDESSGGKVLVIVAAVVVSIAGCVLFAIGIFFVTRRLKKKKKRKANKKRKKKKSQEQKVTSGSEETSDSEGTDGAHIYWEIPYT